MTAHEGTTENPFTYIGAYGVMQEGDGDLYLMRERYYDASTARFISRDPVISMHPKALNPYQYAFGNPLHYVDVTGHFPKRIATSEELAQMSFDEFQAYNAWLLEYFARRERERAEDEVRFDKAMDDYDDVMRRQREREEAEEEEKERRRIEEIERRKEAARKYEAMKTRTRPRPVSPTPATPPSPDPTPTVPSQGNPQPAPDPESQPDFTPVPWNGGKHDIPTSPYLTFLPDEVRDFLEYVIEFDSKR
jgi:RHS repeat-associated protein